MTDDLAAQSATPKPKRRKRTASLADRAALEEQVLSGKLSIGESIRALRKQTGLTQAEFGKRFDVFERVQLNIENDNANPTVETLNKILQPFGLCVGIVKKRGNN
ncbi:MAG TPA: helix-turn-helix domain-containing protein [Spongiibacteraceae bacterium]|nr:helix-turn-helix domain-containing protein [Spongiibacteraceae bacterium]